jgi:hypothetical protein
MTTFRFATMLLACLCVFLLGGFSNAQGSNSPSIQYSPIRSRLLIFVNNPEQLYNSDLGDVDRGNVAVYRSNVGPGAYRNWFEHTNRTGVNIGYAVAVRNTSTSAITVKYYGKGFVTGFQGGKPFIDMFNTYLSNPTIYTVSPGSRLWLWRNDNSAANTNFFSGVIDFDIIGGTVDVENIAYRTFNNLTGAMPYQGYIQRIESDGTHCARQYKGIWKYSAVETSALKFTIGNTDFGPLNVLCSDYDLAAKKYKPAVTRAFWFSNIGPGQNAQATTSDMFSWKMPGWGLIDPLTKSDGEAKYPNLGNWGVMYIVKGSVRNLGTFSRNLSINLKAPNGGGSPIAYRGNDGVWRELKINAGANIQYYTFSVAAGETKNFEARYILGGPGAGSLTNTITVNNTQP